ncbi:MAG: radical SAM protein [Firmicutes bacterium]|nr:radical SAM protein [Bacillota bacterium]MDH7495905.1 radical SAM protein [Bacillota bacterium]
MLRNCRLCPRLCGKDRLAGETGFCGAGALPRVALASLHHWEEPCVSGTNGSGAVFFSHCNLRCVFCQNHTISHGGFGKDITVPELAEVFSRLARKGAHNINLVTPSHFLPQVAWAVRMARDQGLAIPVVYNTNAYELPESLALLEGIVDVYLPDLKYSGEAPASHYSAARDYFARATSAILEMQRQVGSAMFSSEGIMARGLLVRHLVLPGLAEDSKKVLDWIGANLPRDTYVSVMSQYVPAHLSPRHVELNRRLTPEEYDEVLDHFDEIGLENGFMQDFASQDSSFTPEFDLTGLEGLGSLADDGSGAVTRRSAYCNCAASARPR